MDRDYGRIDRKFKMIDCRFRQLRAELQAGKMIDRGFGQLYPLQADKMFGGLIKDEKKPEEKLKTGSKSINEVGMDEYLENRPEKKVEIYDLVSDSDYTSDSDSDSDVCYNNNHHERFHRVQTVRAFTTAYKFALGVKICVYPDGPPIFTESDKCYGPTWVGVHGMQSICMVTSRDMDMKRLHPFYWSDSLKHQNMRLFAKAAISEVECLPHKDVDHYDGAFRQLCTGTVEKPFAVVSLGPGTCEEFGCQDLQATKFLEAVPSEALHTHYGIIRVAIETYQLLFDKVLRAEDIWVTIMNVSSGFFDHLPMDIIGEQLALVHGCYSEKDQHQKPLFVVRGVCEEFDFE